MNRHLLALAGALAMLSPAHALDIQLPAETATPASGRQPRRLSAAQCLMCHSVDYLSTQPPMPLGFWEAEVKKMVAVYGAPIAPDQAQLIIQYLNQAYPRPGAPARREVGRTGKAGAGRPARHAGVPLSAYHWATPARGTAGAILEARMLQPVSANTDLPAEPAPALPALRVSTLSPVLPGVPDHLDRQPVRQPGHLGAVRRRGLDHHHRTEQPAAGRHDPGGRRLSAGGPVHPDRRAGRQLRPPQGHAGRHGAGTGRGLFITILAFAGLLHPITLIASVFCIAIGSAVVTPGLAGGGGRTGAARPRGQRGAAEQRQLQRRARGRSGHRRPAAGALGAPWVFLLNCFCYGGLIWAIWRWKRDLPERRLPPERLLQGAVTALRYTQHSTVTRVVMLRASPSACRPAPLWALLPLLAHEHDGGSAMLYGYMLGALGLGAILGSVLVRRVQARWAPAA